MEKIEQSIIKPPFTEETARKKVKMAQDAWNTKDPEIVARAYSVDSHSGETELHFLQDTAQLKNFFNKNGKKSWTIS